MKSKALWRGLFILLFLFAFIPAQAAPDAVITVDTTSDLLDAGHEVCSAVTTTDPGPDGVWSLREAICAANNHSGADTIEFDIDARQCDPAPSYVCTIIPSEALPALTDDYTIINGYTQTHAEPPTESAPALIKIEIDGSATTDVLPGLTINSAHNGVAGLAIFNFDHTGIRMWGIDANYNRILGNHLGTNAAGDKGVSNGFDGVSMEAGASYNQVGDNDSYAYRNVISDNLHRGVWIDGFSVANTVQGNYIGVDPVGDADMGNAWAGIALTGAAQETLIGGTTRGSRNIICGNGAEGIFIDGGNVYSNTIQGNYIGVGADGTTGIGNDWSGITIGNGSDRNTIGGVTASARNVIADNARAGISLNQSGALGNTISANLIGTTSSGNSELGNQWEGISLFNSPNNTIGGDTTAERNVISGNQQHGIWIYSSQSISNTISGNYIGLGLNGSTDLGNTYSGILVGDDASATLIGGAGGGMGNVISGNDTFGIAVYGADTFDVQIYGNIIGADAGGTLDRGNDQIGVYIYGGAHLVTLGGTGMGERNLISGNNDFGVAIYGGGTISNTVAGNFIGTDADGTIPLPNNGGVYIGNGATYNTVGPWNLVSGNTWNGVEIYGVGSEYNTIIGNYIGTDDSGTGDLGNGSSGVKLYGFAQNNTVGGPDPEDANVIAGNDYHGVWLNGANTSDNTVLGNLIGVGANGTAMIGNLLDGVRIESDAHDNTIGPGNTIAHSQDDGVRVHGAITIDNTITQNSIYSNTLGISLTAGGNTELAAPAISGAAPGAPGMIDVSGTACNNCTVEIFTNPTTDGEGKIYLGSGTATGGSFSVAVSAAQLLSYHHLTATATNGSGDTSEFSAVHTFVPEYLYLPMLVNNP